MNVAEWLQLVTIAGGFFGVVFTIGKLAGRLEQVIRDHERRISALEGKRGTL